MEHDEHTGSRQEPQEYWQQQYDGYGQQPQSQQQDYAGTGGAGYEQGGYPQQYAYPQEQQQSYGYPQQDGSYAYPQQQAYDPSAYQQQATGYESYEQSAYTTEYQQSEYQQSGYQQTGYEQSGYEQSAYAQQTQQSYGQDAGYYDPAAQQQYGYYAADPQDTGEQPQPAWDSAAIPGQAPAPERESLTGDAPDPEADEVRPSRSGATAVRRGEDGGGLRARVVDAARSAGAGGGGRRTLVTRLAVGGAALVVLAVAGYYVAGSGSSGGSSGGSSNQADIGVNHTKAWAAPADLAAGPAPSGTAAATGGSSGGGSSSGADSANDGLIGSWMLANAVVRGDGYGVTAYSATDGHKLWSVAAPSSGAVPCAMSPSVNGSGLGAVLFQAQPGTGQACQQLVAVDTATGQAKWQAKLPAGSGSSYGSSVMVNDTRVVTVGDAGAIGYDLSGKQSWTYAGPGKYCALSGNGDGAALLLQSTCADTSPKQQVISLDPVGGKLRWWRGLPQNAASYTVLSASPAVVSVHMSDSTKDTLMSFTDKGDSQATIPVAQTGGTLDSTHGSFDPDPAIFFAGTSLIAAVQPSASSAAAASGPTVIAAYSLVSGKELWRTTAQEKGVAVPVGVDGGNVVVATDERVGQPARLSHFDLNSGAETVGGTFPTGTGSLLGSGRVLFRDGLVVALPEYTSSYHTSVTAWKAAAS